MRQLLASPTNLVIATARAPGKATALHNLQKTAKGTLHVIKLDISDFDSIRASAKELQAILGETGLDYLINNAVIIRTTLHAPLRAARSYADLCKRMYHRHPATLHSPSSRRSSSMRSRRTPSVLCWSLR